MSKNTRFAFFILTVAFAATACTNPDRSSSGQQDLNGRLLIVDSTPTPTATVSPPVVVGLQIDETIVLSPFPTPTPHPVIDPNFDLFLFPWFDGPNWNWLPLALP